MVQKRVLRVAAAMIVSAAILNGATSVSGQVAGTSTLAITAEQMKLVGVGGFLGLGRKEVAVPVSLIHDQQGKLVLPGATKDALKAMPQFEYSM